MFESWPFTNFHDLNLDWIVGRIKNVETSEANAKASADSAANSAIEAAASKLGAASSAAAAATSAEASANSAESVRGLSEQVILNTAEINQIVTGSVPVDANAELTNIRIAADGTVYGTAGDSVRGQFTELKTGVYTLQHLIQGSYNSAGAVVSNAARIRNAGFIPVHRNDVMTFTPGTTATSLLYGTFDSGKNFGGDSTWITEETTIKFNFNGYIICVFRVSGNNENLTPDDYDATLTITRTHNIDMLASDMDLYAGNVQANIPPRNCINFYFGNDNCDIEEGNGSVYLRVGPSFVVRAGINGVVDDAAYQKYYQEIHLEHILSYPTYEESIGTALVTSPGGMPNCIEIPEWYSLVFNMSSKLLKLVPRISIKKDDIVLLTNRDGSLSYLHPYFLKLYMDKKIGIGDERDVLKRLKNARHVVDNMTSTLTIAHFSDIHADTSALSRIMTDIGTMQEQIDDVICSGDMVENTAGAIAAWWYPNVMTAIGNHDAATYNGSTYNWNALTMAEKEAYYITPFEENWNIVHAQGTSYYYKDYPQQHVRMVVLDGQLYWNPGTEAAGQTSWLAGVLNDAAANNYHVMIVIHGPAPGAEVVDCSFSRYARREMTSLTDSFTPVEVVNTVRTAINNGLEFIGYLTGHNHQDYIYKAAEKQLGICVTCANVVNENQWKGSDQDRDYTMDAYNLVTVDTYDTTVKIIRAGGADCDNLTRERVAISFNYTTGEMINEVK